MFGIQTKVLLIGLAVALLLGSVATTYHVVVVSSLSEEVHKQKESIIKLEADNATLVANVATIAKANATLNSTINSLAEQTSAYAALLESYETKQKELSEKMDASRDEVIATMQHTITTLSAKDGTPAVALYVNKQLSCLLTHVGVIGSCIDGEWVVK